MGTVAIDFLCPIFLLGTTKNPAFHVFGFNDENTVA